MPLMEGPAGSSGWPLDLPAADEESLEQLNKWLADGKKIKLAVSICNLLIHVNFMYMLQLGQIQNHTLDYTKPFIQSHFLGGTPCTNIDNWFACILLESRVEFISHEYIPGGIKICQFGFSLKFDFLKT